MDALMHSLFCEAVEDEVVDSAIDNAHPAIANTPEDATKLSTAVSDSEDIPDEEDLINVPDVADDINDFLDDENVPGVPEDADMPDDGIDLDALDDPSEDEPEDEPDVVSTGGEDDAIVVGSDIPAKPELTDPDDDLPEWAKNIQAAVHDKVEKGTAPVSLEHLVATEDRLMACESLDQFLTLDHKFGQTTTNPEEVNAEAQPVNSIEPEFVPKDREVRSELNDSRN